MSKELEQHIESMQQRAMEMAESREDILQTQSDITMIMLGNLMIKLGDSIDDMVEGVIKNNSAVSGLGEIIKKTIGGVIEEFMKQKPPQVTVNPTINVDLKPMIGIANEISSQQKTFIELVKKMSITEPGSIKYEALVALSTEVMKGISELLKKGFQQVDIRPELQQIIQLVSNKERIESIEIKRDHGVFTGLKPVYKTNKL